MNIGFRSSIAISRRFYCGFRANSSFDLGSGVP
jgi:hypothetical protein